MSRTTALRPCLKHSADLDPPAAAANSSPFPFALSSSVLGPRVRFPPAPGLCQTHLTHSSTIYDRAPIVVAPNACALPARNERTYTLSTEHPTTSTTTPPSSSAKKRRSMKTASALHPNAFRDPAAKPPQASSLSDQAALLPPPLIPDLSSSESDESDINSAPPNPMFFSSTGHPPITIVDGAVGSEGASLSFLPHANGREKPRRERGRSRSRGSPRSVRQSEFAIPELDGCLGGF